MIRFARTAALIATMALTACATSDSGGSKDARATASAPGRTAPGFSPEPVLELCPRMTISNAPPTNANRQVLGYAPFAKVNGVQVLVNPAPNSCLSSNFGQRNGRLHKGIDLQSRPAGPVIAAGPGTVVESGYRNDYGNYVLIKHSDRVFTRYAHLRSITGEGQEGRVVQTGTVLGIMGNTASYSIPIHLHYEVLTGDYATPKGAFGLTPVDILKSASR